MLTLTSEQTRHARNPRRSFGIDSKDIFIVLCCSINKSGTKNIKNRDALSKHDTMTFDSSGFTLAFDISTGLKLSMFVSIKHIHPLW